MTRGNERDKSADPILNLPVHSSIASLCFVSHGFSEKEDDESDSSEESFEFRTSRLQKAQGESYNSAGKNLNILKNRYLTTCHHDGTVLLWDLSRREDIAKLSLDGPCLSLKRFDVTQKIMCQTRDLNGTVSILDINREFCVENQLETFSQTFCQAAPCIGNRNLLALPSRQDNTFTVVDLRSNIPIDIMPIENNGMLTSLAMAVGDRGRPIVACGMESGSVIFHHLTDGHTRKRGVHSLSKDPVLSLDLFPSSNPLSVLAVAGMAGDAAEIGEVPKSEQGRIALLKATHTDDWNITMRARLDTCRVDDTSYGKPGVGICKFRPVDGRLFAVGGWDHRIRIFERSQGKAMAILRGHTDSVDCLDWATDAHQTGLLASASSKENRVYLWQCFAKNN